MNSSDCIFCKIIAGEIPAETLYSDDEVVVFRDINPQAPVHFLLVPKRHIPMPRDVSAADEAVMGRLFTIAAKIADQEGVADNYRIILNNGPKAGQEVFHIHMHILGGRSKPLPI